MRLPLHPEGDGLAEPEARGGAAEEELRALLRSGQLVLCCRGSQDSWGCATVVLVLCCRGSQAGCSCVAVVLVLCCRGSQHSCGCAAVVLVLCCRGPDVVCRGKWHLFRFPRRLHHKRLSFVPYRQQSTKRAHLVPPPHCRLSLLKAHILKLKAASSTRARRLTATACCKHADHGAAEVSRSPSFHCSGSASCHSTHYYACSIAGSFALSACCS